MEIITTQDGKQYRGKLIMRQITEHGEYLVYQTNVARDKYLVLYHNGEAKSFVVTGYDRIIEIMDFLRRQPSPARLWEKISNDAKSMGRKDWANFRNMFHSYYDKRYPLFVYLGLPFALAFEKVKESI